MVVREQKMKGGILAICFYLFLSIPSVSKAQDPIFSQFFSASTYLNPAFAGANDCSQLVFNYRNLPWSGFGTFSTFNFSIDTYLPKLSSGLAFLLTSDHQGGLVYNNQISGIYSHRIKLSEDFYVNLGLQGGYFRKNLRWDRLVFSDQIDPATGQILPQTESPPPQTWTDGVDFSSGLLFYGNGFYGGFGVHHLTSPNTGFFEAFELPKKYTAHAGFFLPVKQTGFGVNKSEEIFISPNIILQQQGQHKRLNYGLYAGISSFVAGVWFRHQKLLPATMIFLVGLQLDGYKIGYSFDYSLSGYSGALYGAHEVSISYNFNCNQKNKRRIILNCPIF